MPRYSDVFTIASPKAQDYMKSMMAAAPAEMEENPELGGNGAAVDAILKSLAAGEEYDFKNNFDVGTPEGMMDLMGTMSMLSGKVSPDQREGLRKQATTGMLEQMTSEVNPNRPLQQHAMGEMIRRSLQVGGAPLADPSALPQQGPPGGGLVPQGAPPSPGGAIQAAWVKKMEQIELALQAEEIDEATAQQNGWTPDWRQRMASSGP